MSGRLDTVIVLARLRSARFPQRVRPAVAAAIAVVLLVPGGAHAQEPPDFESWPTCSEQRTEHCIESLTVEGGDANVWVHRNGDTVRVNATGGIPAQTFIRLVVRLGSRQPLGMTGLGDVHGYRVRHNGQQWVAAIDVGVATFVSHSEPCGPECGNPERADSEASAAVSLILHANAEPGSGRLLDGWVSGDGAREPVIGASDLYGIGIGLSAPRYLSDGTPLQGRFRAFIPNDALRRYLHIEDASAITSENFVAHKEDGTLVSPISPRITPRDDGVLVEHSGFQHGMLAFMFRNPAVQFVSHSDWRLCSETTAAKCIQSVSVDGAPAEHRLLINDIKADDNDDVRDVGFAVFDVRAGQEVVVRIRVDRATPAYIAGHAEFASVEDIDDGDARRITLTMYPLQMSVNVSLDCEAERPCDALSRADSRTHQAVGAHLRWAFPRGAFHSALLATNARDVKGLYAYRDGELRFSVYNVRFRQDGSDNQGYWQVFLTDALLRRQLGFDDPERVTAHDLVVERIDDGEVQRTLPVSRRGDGGVWLELRDWEYGTPRFVIRNPEVLPSLPPDPPKDPYPYTMRADGWRLCPNGEVPGSAFTDVDGNVHAPGVNCVAWHGVATGTSTSAFSPKRLVNRAQMAAFLARTLAAKGVDLPAPTDQAFDDISGNVHADAINQLAELGVAAGREANLYDPTARVTRAQMATFLVRAAEVIADQTLSSDGDHFGDDEADPHERNINKAAAAGLVQGTDSDSYSPLRRVRRDQMASFLSRTLEFRSG